MVRNRVANLDSVPTRKAESIEPMECALVSKLPEGSDWTYEVKLDGYRAIGVKSTREAIIYSRNGKNFNKRYPHLADALGHLPADTVLDGEVVALDDSGRPDFRALQHFKASASRIHYFAFDLLVVHGRDMMNLPLTKRRELMKSVLKLPPHGIRVSEQFDIAAENMLSAVRKQGLEGALL